MKNQVIRRGTLLAATGALIVGLLSGCAWSIGGRKEGSVSTAPTRGQQLIDLKKARDQGAITEEEYQAQKKRVLEN